MNWVQVRHRYPEQEKPILFYEPANGIHLGQYLEDLQFIDQEYIGWEATHWMYLPEDPK